MNDAPTGQGDADSGHKRRERYSGTHPRQFSQRYKELSAAPDSQIHTHVRAQGRTPAGTHRPVMVEQVLTALQPAPGNAVADCTLGFGGHAEALLSHIGSEGRLLGLDVDEASLAATQARLTALGYGEQLAVRRSNFAGLSKFVGETLWGESRPPLVGFEAVVADLGVSSMQIDNPQRGFAYKFDGPLDMRMDPRIRRTAADWIAKLTAHELAQTLRDFGDEPAADEIAAEIVARRERSPLQTTRALVKCIEDATGFRRGSAPGVIRETHPAARVFQALRMLVNDEMGALRAFLRGLPFALAPGGRAAILTFHSGEARCVGEAFAEGAAAGYYASISPEGLPPTADETHANPRSRSARLWFATRSK